MIFEIEARVVVKLELQPGDKQPRLLQTQLNLGVSPNIDKTMYLENDLPNANGAHVLTSTLIQGLVSNIHNSHQRGFWNDVEHITFIMSELEKGFVAIADAGEGNFSKTDLPANPVVNFNYDGITFKSPKFNKGSAFYKIAGVDPDKSILFIEIGVDDKPISNDEEIFELWDGANLYTINKNPIK